MAWTAKHRQLSIEKNWWRSEQRLIEYLLTKGSLNESFVHELDHQGFDSFMRKNGGKPYHRTMLPKIMKQIEERTEGLIIVLKNYGHGTYKVLVRPISFVFENRKSKAEKHCQPKLGNPMFSEEHKERLVLQQQQDISKLDYLFKKTGVVFDQNALNRIWQLSGKCIDKVRKAVEFMLYRHSEGIKKIRNPQGYLMECLRDGWANNFDIYYEPELPTFKSRLDISKFIGDAFNEMSSKKIGVSADFAPTPN